MLLFWPERHPSKLEAPQEGNSRSRVSRSNDSPVRIAKATNVSPAGARARLMAAARAGDSNAFYSQFQSVWQAPIDFYGMVVDQNSNPVPGAHIHFSWSELPTEDGMRSADTQSGADGLFSLYGKHGRGLDISVGKEGYYSSRRDPSAFNYALGPDILSPDRFNPVVFHLRKKGNSVAVIQTHFPIGMGQRVQLHHDGTPVELDLVNARETPAGTGQLRLEFWRDVSDRKAAKFDWKLQVSAPGGGIIPTDQEFAFEAPDSGYQPAVVFDMTATGTNWTDDFRAKYYVHLPDGNFGCVDIYLLAYNGVFTVHSVINPTGARNLEPAN